MKTKIVSVRIERDLLAKLEGVARAEQRSLSGQIVHSIRQTLSSYLSQARPKHTMGWLKSRRVPEYREFRLLRRALSKQFRRRSP